MAAKGTETQGLMLGAHPLPDRPMWPGDRKLKNVADPGNVGPLTAGSHGKWFGLAPDDSPLFARNISTQEIYALEME
ncbi:MAG TPA: hypothetical protein VK729_00710 [Silvibacterium sp.]|jgi:hypothetical protein|nr:hypothetical protein [Silvibacterium sp.]